MSVRALAARTAGVMAALAAAAGLLGAVAPSASAVPVKVAEMRFYDDYWTLGECREVGEWGKGNGKWTVYVCQWSGWDYDLYYDS